MPVLHKDDPVQETCHWMVNRAHPFPLNPDPECQTPQPPLTFWMVRHLHRVDIMDIAGGKKMKRF